MHVAYKSTSETLSEWNNVSFESWRIASQRTCLLPPTFPKPFLLIIFRRLSWSWRRLRKEANRCPFPTVLSHKQIASIWTGSLRLIQYNRTLLTRLAHNASKVIIKQSFLTSHQISWRGSQQCTKSPPQWEQQNWGGENIVIKRRRTDLPCHPSLSLKPAFWNCLRISAMPF